jgi:hypothetical protein
MIPIEQASFGVGLWPSEVLEVRDVLEVTGSFGTLVGTLAVRLVSAEDGWNGAASTA